MHRISKISCNIYISKLDQKKVGEVGMRRTDGGLSVFQNH